MHVFCLAYSSTQKTEATCSSETSVDFQRTTRCYIQEDRILRGFYGFPQSFQANSGIVPRLCHCRFLPNTFQLIIHQSSYRSMLYSFHILATSYNKPQTDKPPCLVFSCPLRYVYDEPLQIRHMP
jgi:hypothetical protein